MNRLIATDLAVRHLTSSRLFLMRNGVQPTDPSRLAYGFQRSAVQEKYHLFPSKIRVIVGSPFLALSEFLVRICES
jgi:hypothetical protein